MLNIVIISRYSSDLERIISSYLERKNIEFSLYTYQSCLALLNKKDFFDIVYMDIHFLKKTVLFPYILVFTNTISILRTFSMIERPNSVQEVEQQLILSLKKLKEDKKRSYLKFKENKAAIYIHPREIIYFEYSNRKIRIVTNIKVYNVYCSLKKLQATLENYSFAMPHKAFLVNLYEIRKISFEGIFLSNGDIIPIAKRNVVKFKVLYKQFRQNYMNSIAI
ncbi:MAG: response regulator [Firmicutes bacterium]|nr:response regulator [Bacillota bacterium]